MINLKKMFYGIKYRLKNSNKLLIMSITIAIFIICVFGIHFVLNLVPKKYNLNNADIYEKEKNMSIVSIEKGKIFSKITIKKILTDEELKDFYNYISGEGKNYYFNYKILLEKDNKVYATKTIVLDKNTGIFFDKREPKDNSIYIQGIFLNKKFFENNYNISLIQKDYENESKVTLKKYYKCIGRLGDKTNEE